jgi:hypothetical protein
MNAETFGKLIEYGYSLLEEKKEEENYNGSIGYLQYLRRKEDENNNGDRHREANRERW